MVDRTRGDVGAARRVRAREALVVPEVQVRLRAVLGDEHLAVLERRHRPRVHVDVRVELLEGDLQASRHEQAADRCGRDALAERRDDAAGDEDEARARAGIWHLVEPVYGGVQRRPVTLLRGPPEAVQRAQRPDPLDRRGDRAQLAVDGQRQDGREGDGLPYGPQRGHEPQPRERAEHVRAGVAEHRALAQVEQPEDDQRAGERAERPQRLAVPARERDRRGEEHERLDGAAGPEVQEVEQVRGERDQSDGQEELPGREARAGERGGREREGSERLQRAGREAAPGDLARVAAPAAGGRVEQVVQEAEEGDAERSTAATPGRSTSQPASSSSAARIPSATIAAAIAIAPAGNGSSRPASSARGNERSAPGASSAATSAPAANGTASTRGHRSGRGGGGCVVLARVCFARPCAW